MRVSLPLDILPDDVKAKIINVHQALTTLALIQVFGKSEREAATLVGDLWEKFASAPGSERDLFLHNEPIAVACDLLQKDWSSIDPTKLDIFNREREQMLNSSSVSLVYP